MIQRGNRAEADRAAEGYQFCRIIGRRLIWVDPEHFFAECPNFRIRVVPRPNTVSKSSGEFEISSRTREDRVLLDVPIEIRSIEE